MASVVTRSLKLLSSSRCYNGVFQKYSHASTSTLTDMKFSVFLPASAVAGEKKAPALYFLAGLSSTEDNFIQKAGAIKSASSLGVALICPDTSPRGDTVPKGDGQYDFALGAGFYVNATVAPYATNYRMYEYVTKELPALVQAELPINDRRSISGHSMGGHGALISYFKNPGMYQSVSAFSPICNPMACPWGQKAFTGYLGDNKEEWKNWDASVLLGGFTGDRSRAILVDQGTADEFLAKKQLLPETLIAAANEHKQALQHNMREGFDHSYWFIQSFIDDHIAHHARYLHAATDGTPATVVMPSQAAPTLAAAK